MSETICLKKTFPLDENKNCSTSKNPELERSTKFFQNKVDTKSLAKSLSFHYENNEDNNLLNEYYIPLLSITTNGINRKPNFLGEKVNIPINSMGISFPISFISSHSGKNSFKNEIHRKNDCIYQRKNKSKILDEIIPDEPKANHIEHQQKLPYRGGIVLYQEFRHKAKKKETLIVRKNERATFIIIYEDLTDNNLPNSKVNKLNKNNDNEENPTAFNVFKTNSLVAQSNEYDLMKCKNNLDPSSLNANHNFLCTPRTSKHKKNNSSFTASHALSSACTPKVSLANTTRKELLQFTQNEMK